MEGEKLTLTEALELSKKMIAACGGVVAEFDRTIDLSVYIFAITRTLAGLAVVGFGISYKQLPTDDAIEQLVATYRDHLKDARAQEMQHDGKVN